MNTKTIHRTKLKTRFTTLPNDLLRSKYLSLRARGLLAMMLSHSEEWRACMRTIEEAVNEGRDAVRRTVQELESAGYAVRKYLINEQREFEGILWTWHDSPVPMSERSSPKVRGPSPENPSDGKSGNIRKNKGRQNTASSKRLVCKGGSSGGGISIGYIPSPDKD